jgi:hypothetical protein
MSRKCVAHSTTGLPEIMVELVDLQGRLVGRVLNDTSVIMKWHHVAFKS